MDGVVKRLNEATDAAGLNKSAFGRVIGLDPAQASRTLSGERKLTLEEAGVFCADQGLNLDWLLYDKGEMHGASAATPSRELRHVSLEEEAREEEEDLARRNAGFGTAGHFKPTIEGAIPEIDVLAGAGSGVVGEVINLRIGANTVSGHKVVEEWKMPEAYLSAELHVSPFKSLVMPVIGDSMTPTYKPGDRVLIDLNQTEMTIDAIYVISDGESPPQIKRLQRVMFSRPHMVDIISDNGAHQTQRVELALLTIIGRVAGVVSKQ